MCFTNRQLDNRCKRLKDIDAQIKALQAAADSIKSEIKADMDAENVTEIKTGNYTIRYKDVTTTRLDSTALKNALPDVYTLYSTTTTSRRFTVA